MNKTRLAVLFRSWFNEFLTVPRFAAYYCLTEKKAEQVIRVGRKCHEAGH
jgi:hypothetical protein